MTNRSQISFGLPPSDILKQIQSTISQILSDTSTIAYQNQVTEIKTLLRQYSKNLSTVRIASPPQDAFFQLRQTLNSLSELIGTLAEHRWLSVALTWSVRHVPRSLAEHMDQLADHLTALQCPSVVRFCPAPDLIAQDYEAVSDFFADYPQDDERIRERLASISNVLQTSPVPQKVASLFEDFGNILLNHSDYVVDRELATGASGKVFLAHEKTTGQVVAIKEMLSRDLEEYDVSCFTREIRALATLKHPHLIELFGATATAPFWIVTEFASGRSLYRRLRESPPLDDTRATIIAYQIAQGMAYLHSRNMIHRDLKSLNVLLDASDDARICDFGFTRPVDSDQPMTGYIGTYHYMSPEVISYSVYGLKADVFSYGMLLWEMVTHQYPFEWFQNDQVKITTAILRGNRPDIPAIVSGALENLIANCWDQEPSQRPTFHEILQIFCAETIAFPSADLHTVKAFYAKQNPAMPAEDDRARVVELLKRPSGDLLECLQRINNSSIAIQSLRAKEFVAEATPLLMRSEYAEVVGQTLFCVIDNRELAEAFVGAGGSRGLARMLRSGNDGEARVAGNLARRTAEVISESGRYELVGHLFEGKRIEPAIEIIDLYRLDVTRILETHRTHVIAATETSRRACELVCQSVGVSALQPDEVTVGLALHCGSIPFVDRLLRNETFRGRLAAPGAANAVAEAAGVSESRECALKLAIRLSGEQIESLAGNSDFLDAVAAIPDVDEAAVLLGPLAKRRDGAKGVLRLLEKCQSRLESAAVCAVFANVASHFPDEVLAFGWLITAIVISVQKLERLSANLVIVRELANSGKIVGQTDLMKTLTWLLKSAECDLDETCLLMEIFAKISPLCSFLDVYQYLLQAAESLNGFCCFALMAVAQQHLPRPQTRYSRRLIAIVKRFLESDVPGQQKAVANLIARMALKRPYLRLIAEELFPVSILRTLLRTGNPEVFESLLESVQTCRIQVG